MEDLAISDRPMIRDGLSIRELIESGATFEIEGERYDFENEDMYDNDDDSEIPEEAIRPNPCQAKFLDIKAEMIQLSCYVYKKTLKDGDYRVPKGSRVSIHYNSYFEGENMSYDSTYMRGKPTVFTLGNNEVLYGLEYAVETMKRNEESQFIISWQWLYGEHGCPPRIKPKADALFNVRLIEFREVTAPFVDDPDGEITKFFERLQEAAKYDSLAKDAFKKK